MKDVSADCAKNKAGRPAMPWFRMYSEFATDPKVQMLSEADQRRFLMLLCLRCSNGDVTLQDAECAFQMRISEAEYAQTKAVLVARGLIDEDNQPTAWEKRQYRSDSSKFRVSSHRERKRKEAKTNCNVTVTPQIQITDTETDTEILETAQQEAAREAPSIAALPAAPSGLADLHDRLVNACNGSLDNPANCLGLLSMATPQMWLERGADLERDVIPTLEAAGKKYHGKRIRDWNYFTPMVADAVEKRKAVMPKGSGSAPKESARARRAKIFEKYQQEGRI